MVVGRGRRRRVVMGEEEEGDSFINATGFIITGRREARRRQPCLRVRKCTDEKVKQK